MKRIQEEILQNWYKNKLRKPLVLRGARQVGKSTLIRQFAQNEKLKLLEINLEKRKSWDQHFSKLDISSILIQLEDFFEKKIDISETTCDLLFFDEIQATPSLLACLRYFYEELPHLPVICAGSLLEFALNKNKISLPVGRIEYLFMGPMNFKEYLWAKNEKYLLDKIENFKIDSNTWSTEIHEKLLKIQREYLFVGGMPESVSTYLNTLDSKKTRKTQSQIMEIYIDDFNKYAKETQVPRLHLIFDYLFFNIGKKIKFSNITHEHGSRELKSAIELLFQARIFTPVYHSSGKGIPLSAGISPNIFKVLALDVGLLNYKMQLNWKDILTMDERTLLNEGPLAEQFVGQQLLSTFESFMNPQMFYWLREGKSDNAELDFLFQSGRDLLAIEVKSGKSGTLRSLHQWNHEVKYEKKQSIRFDLNLPSKNIIQVKLNNNSELSYELTSLPLYFAGNLDTFCK